MTAVLYWLALANGFFAMLVIAALLARLAYAVNERVAAAPALDVVVSVFTWIPWAIGGWVAGWRGVVAAVAAEFALLHAFGLIDRAVRGWPARTLGATHGRLVGPIRNQLALLATLPAVPVFLAVRVLEVGCWPVIARLARLPRYRQSEWVVVSRHKFRGLSGYDLVWCWYCDWMTGVWALGSEMLRNVESLWCPIRFESDAKNANVALDFPDIERWAPPDGKISDVVRLVEEKYSGRDVLGWREEPPAGERSEP